MSWSETMYIIQNSGVKKVQRGTTSGSGNVSISSVNMDKAFVVSASKGSTGYVAATGNIGSQAVSVDGTVSLSGTLQVGAAPTTYGNTTTRDYSYSSGSWNHSSSGTATLSGTAAGTSISGGSTSLTVREYSARLTGSTTLSCDGPVEWQVIEFY